MASWIKNVIEKEGKNAGEINIILTSDEGLVNINVEFLGRDYYTDIITFDYSEDNIINGELYISVDRTKENAVKFEVDELRELLRVIIHGILHMIGYNDSTEDEKKEMRIAEEKYLSEYITGTEI